MLQNILILCIFCAHAKIDNSNMYEHKSTGSYESTNAQKNENGESVDITSQDPVDINKMKKSSWLRSMTGICVTVTSITIMCAGCYLLLNRKKSREYALHASMSQSDFQEYITSTLQIKTTGNTVICNIGHKIPFSWLLGYNEECEIRMQYVGTPNISLKEEIEKNSKYVWDQLSDIMSQNTALSATYINENNSHQMILKTLEVYVEKLLELFQKNKNIKKINSFYVTYYPIATSNFFSDRGKIEHEYIKNM